MAHKPSHRAQKRAVELSRSPFVKTAEVREDSPGRARIVVRATDFGGKVTDAINYGEWSLSTLSAVEPDGTIKLELL